MAVFVQKTPNTTLPAEGNNVTSLAVTFDTKPVAGHFIGVLFASNGGFSSTFSSLADNRGNTYAAGKTQTDAALSIAAVYYALNAATGSPFTITLTFAAASFFDMGAVEFAGVDTTGSPVATSGNSATGTTTPSTGAIVPPGNAVYFGVFGTDNVDLTSLVLTKGIELWNEPSKAIESAAMAYLTTVTGSQNFTWLIAPAADWNAVGAAFGETLPAPTVFASIPTSKKLAATVWQGQGIA